MTVELKEINKKEMGERIRARREALHISRDELGKILGVTGKFISDIEYGDKGVSLKNLYKLKQVLNVSTDFILEGDHAGTRFSLVAADYVNFKPVKILD